METVAEFNTKYKDYLEAGHYGLDIHDKKVIEILDNIFQDLIQIPNFKYAQIKEKWGTITFYSTLSNYHESAVETLIQKLIKL